MYPNLKLQLWKTGIRQNRLAKILSMDETILSKIVNGFREPSAQLRERISQVLECDAAWLFEEVAQPNGAAGSSAPRSSGTASSGGNGVDQKAEKRGA